MKKVIKKFSTVFIVFLLLTMTTSNIISYAADENKEHTSPNALLSFSQALQANDVNSTFTASWNGTHSSTVDITSCQGSFDGVGMISDDSAPRLPHIVTKNGLKILKATRNRALKSGYFSVVFA